MLPEKLSLYTLNPDRKVSFRNAVDWKCLKSHHLLQDHDYLLHRFCRLFKLASNKLYYICITLYSYSVTDA